MIEFKNVSRVYPGDIKALDNVNLLINKGEFVCLVGTSGSGKTTAMRMINRMNVPTSGTIEIGGRDVSRMDEVDLRRQIGYVIQQIGLMPHMTIYENIVMVPKLLKWPEDKMNRIAKELIERVDLSASYLDSYPSELSGGQQQRIGVLRALAADQEIILMDEPFGALDPITRETLQKLIKRLQQDMGKTVIFVTHDMDEAIELSDRIAVMDKGKVIQFDTPENILMNPKNEFVENLLGDDRLNQAKFDYESVSKIMNKNHIKVDKDILAKDAVKIMFENRVDILYVVDKDDILYGHVDLFNINRKINVNKPVSQLIEEGMYVYSDTKIRDVIYYINDLGYRNMPVVDEETHKLVGNITRTSIVDSLFDGLWSDYEPEDDSKIDETSTLKEEFDV